MRPAGICALVKQRCHDLINSYSGVISMQKEFLKLASAQPGNLCSGFRLVKKEPAAALDA